MRDERGKGKRQETRGGGRGEMRVDNNNNDNIVVY